MPPPKKLDLMPPELRDWLQQELAKRGFGEIVEVTEALNFRLEEAGQELRIGKTAVGEFSKALKDQREAFSMAETLLADMDIEQESDLHKVLMQMIATSAVQMMRAVREEDGHLEAKELMALGRMLKDLMQSAGIREKLLTDERERLREEHARELAEKLETAEAQGGINKAAAQAAREVLGLA
ncbi:MAG: phage protein Gp27 family protein [Pseudomonadota bacterium]